MNKILTINGQKHSFKNLTDIFLGLSPEEKASVISILGLDKVVDNDGNPVPIYSVDITSNKPTYITKDYDVTLTAHLYNYFQQVDDKAKSWKWSRNSGNTAGDLAWEVGKTGQELKLSKEDFTDNIFTQDITFTVTVTVGTTEYTDTISFSKLQYLSSVQIKSSANVFIEDFPSTIKLTLDIDQGFEPIEYRWYVDSSFKTSSDKYDLPVSLVPLNSTSTVKVEVKGKDGSTITDSISIPRLAAAKDGEDGVPGADGTSSYTWIKYADGPNGEGMNEYPFKSDGTAREYIGMAVGKNTPIESNNPADYVWSKYIGDQGIPGENGYMWLKYSLYENGRNTAGKVEMYDTPFIINVQGERENMVYLGIAYNKQTKEESNIPENYQWSKIKGDDGRTPYTLELSNDNVSIPTSSTGVAGSTAYELAKTDITLYYGNDTISQDEYTLQFTPTNVIYTLSNNNHTIQITNLTADTGQVLIKAVSDNKVLATATFSVIKVKGTSIYEIIPSSPVIRVMTNVDGTQTLQPTSIDIKIMRNSGDQVTQVYEGKLTYRYIYTSTVNTDDDGTVIPVDNILNLDNSGDPLFIEFKYFHPVSGVMVDRERIPFVRDGVASNSSELRYSKNGSFTVAPTLNVNDPNPSGWSVDLPTMTSSEVLWMTKAVKKPNGELLNPWSNPVRISGPAGPKGDPGAPGEASELFIAPMGKFDPLRKYVGNNKRVEAVTYKTSWYVTRQDADTSNGGSGIPVGTLPTNTDYWNVSDKNFDFIATGLFLAEAAYIDNLMVRNIITDQPTSAKPSPKRIEIKAETNSLKFFTDGVTNAAVVLDAISGYNSAQGSGNSATLAFRKDGSVGTTTTVGTDGIFTNIGNTSFLPISGGADTKASIVGLLFGSEDPEMYLNSYNTAIAGINQITASTNLKGRNFGGYFNTLALGSRYLLGSVISSGTNSSTINPHSGIIVVYSTDHTITLPPLKKISEGWNQGVVWEVTVLKVNSGSLTFTWTGGAQMLKNSGGGRATTLNSPWTTTDGRRRYHIYWDGSYWQIFGTE